MSMPEQDMRAMTPDPHYAELAVKEASPVEAAMNSLRGKIAALDEETALLMQQLAPVLQPRPEVADGIIGDTPHAPRSPHVYDIEEQAMRIHGLLDRIREIRSYLDVR